VYQHTQPGTLIRILVALMILIMLADSWFFMQAAQRKGVLMAHLQNDLLILFGGLFVLLIFLALFHNLKVTVDGECIRLAYGVGIIHKRILLERIAAVRPVTNRWWYGWGIRLIPGGWMWNITGLDAVELEMKKGRKFRIGTDEPEALAAVVKERIAARK